MLRGLCFEWCGLPGPGWGHGEVPLLLHSCLGGVGPSGWLWGPRDLESVIIKQWRPQKPRMEPAPSAGAGLSEGPTETDLVVERAVWLHYHVLELQ